MIRSLSRLLAAAVVLAGAGSCVAEGRREASDDETTGALRQAIRNGAPFDGRPEIVGLMRRGEVICSGTLISDRLVLTAAHCFDGRREGCASSAADEPWFVLFGAKPPTGSWPPDVCADCPFRRITATVVHARYESPGDAHDVAIAVLDTPASSAIQPATPCTTNDASAIGSLVSLVGFGLQAPDDRAPREKRQGTARVAARDASVLTLEPAPATACLHDSGGAMLARCAAGDAEARLAGVIVAGDDRCEARTLAVRADSIWDTFVVPLAAQVRAGSARAGERCFYEGHCAEGVCEPSADDARTSFCSATCTVASTCPPGMACVSPAPGRSPRCQWTPPSPGATSSTCVADGDCLSRVCARAPGATTAKCTVTCSPHLVAPCACGGQCLRDDASPFRRHACLSPPAPAPPPSDGGCAVAEGRAGSPRPLVWCVALSFLLVYRRRDRRARASYGAND